MKLKFAAVAFVLALAASWLWVQPASAFLLPNNSWATIQVGNCGAVASGGTGFGVHYAKLDPVLIGSCGTGPAGPAPHTIQITLVIYINGLGLFNVGPCNLGQNSAGCMGDSDSEQAIIGQAGATYFGGKARLCPRTGSCGEISWTIYG